MIFALAAGVLMSNGSTARLEVFHDGRPIPVRIVGLDESNNEVPIQAIPSRLNAGPRARTVRVKFPSTVTKLCAAFESQSVRALSCSSQLNLREQTGSNNRTGSALGGFRSTLRRALDALRTGQTEPQLHLLEVPATVTHP